MSKFQIVLLIVFGASIIIAVMVFSFYNRGSQAFGEIVVWGDMPSPEWHTWAGETNFNSSKNYTVTYIEKRPENIVREFTEALSEGRGPDLIIIPLDEVWRQRNRLVPISFETISERDFKNTFVEAGELFLGDRGAYALPFTIDPLVLYYNRDLLSRAGMARPITYWDEIYAASGSLTQRDPAGNVTRSVMALGEAANIKHYKSIVSLLMLQAGTPITGIAGPLTARELRPYLTYNFNLPIIPAEAALDFYTQFSNPSKAFYSWNRSMLPADTHFIAGDSAYYIGFASELPILRAKAPTLNFGVASVPQSRATDRVTTYAQLRGLAIARSTRKPEAALSVATILISRSTLSVLSGINYLPPVRRDLLLERQSEEIKAVYYDAALQSRGWLDPDPPRTTIIFRDMIESVTSGRERTSQAVGRAQRELESLTRQR
jgi:ABC-type glycerol-3-phosphate transport system substrate-binding protein